MSSMKAEERARRFMAIELWRRGGSWRAWVLELCPDLEGMLNKWDEIEMEEARLRRPTRIEFCKSIVFWFCILNTLGLLMGVFMHFLLPLLDESVAQPLKHHIFLSVGLTFMLSLVLCPAFASEDRDVNRHEKLPPEQTQNNQST